MTCGSDRIISEALECIAGYTFQNRKPVPTALSLLQRLMGERYEYKEYGDYAVMCVVYHEFFEHQGLLSVQAGPNVRINNEQFARINGMMKNDEFRKAVSSAFYKLAENGNDISFFEFLLKNHLNDEIPGQYNTATALTLHYLKKGEMYKIFDLLDHDNSFAKRASASLLSYQVDVMMSNQDTSSLTPYSEQVQKEGRDALLLLADAMVENEDESIRETAISAFERMYRKWEDRPAKIRENVLPYVEQIREAMLDEPHGVLHERMKLIYHSLYQYRSGPEPVEKEQEE
jgi:hypothetical protein